MSNVELIKSKVLDAKNKGENRLIVDFVEDLSSMDLLELEDSGFKISAGMSASKKERETPNPRMFITIFWKNN